MRAFLRALFVPVFMLVFLCAFAGAAFADSGNFPTNEDLRHYRNMRSPQVSPDGRLVLVEISESTAEGAKDHIWLVDVAANSSRQLTFSAASKEARDRGETSATWMPDGQSVLFLAHRGEHTQLFRLPLAGGEASPFDLKVTPQADASTLSDAIPPAKPKSESKPPEPLPIDVSGFAVAPDGKTIAIWASDPQTPGEKAQQEAKADAIWVGHNLHGSRLYLLDPASGKLQTVPVPPDVHRAEFTEASDRLIVEAEAPNNAGDLGPAGSTYVVTLTDSQHPSKLSTPPDARGFTWSRDAEHLYFFAPTKVDAPPGVSDLYEFTVRTNAIRNLTDGYSGNIAGQTPVVDTNGTLLQPVENGVRLSIARLDPAKPHLVPLPSPTPVMTDLATNARRSAWAFLGAGSTQPVTLFFTENLDSPPRALNTPSLVPDNARAAESQFVEWTNDGRTIQGLLFLPPEAAQHKVPLIVDVHGGPTGQWIDSFQPFASFLVGHGWAVLRPNPRGSTGRGAAFAAANKNDMGGGDYRDIMTGVDAMLKRFPLDPDRLALTGYSYGGEMAGFVEGKTNRFKAIVCGAPVIDQFSEYGTESGSWYDRWFYGKPWEHFEDAWRQSPLSGAAHASTPFMLLQGLGDTTDPPGQSQEMYRALRQMGVPVELIEYPRDNHGALSGGIFGRTVNEPWHGFDARQRIVKFFESAFNGTLAPKAK